MVSLEEMRIGERNAIIIATLIGLIISIPLFIKTYVPHVFLLGGIVGYIIYRIVRPKNYRKLYKEKIISAILKHTKYGWKNVYFNDRVIQFGSNIRASDTRYEETKKQFHQSGIYYTGDQGNLLLDDMFVSKSNTGLKLSEMQLTVGSGKHKKVVFKGLFFNSDINRHFQGETYIKTDKEGFLSPGAGGTFGTNESRKIFSSTVKKTELEWNDFEKILDVHTNNEQEAREILDPQFMEILYEWWHTHKKPLRLSFNKKNFYMTIPSTKNMFEPKAFSSVEKHRKTVWEYLDTFLLIENLFTQIERKYSIDKQLHDLQTEVNQTPSQNPTHDDTIGVIPSLVI